MPLRGQYRPFQAGQVVPDSTWLGERTAYRSAGGRLSATAQPGQSGPARPLTFRAALKPQAATIASTWRFAAASG